MNPHFSIGPGAIRAGADIQGVIRRVRPERLEGWSCGTNRSLAPGGIPGPGRMTRWARCAWEDLLVGLETEARLLGTLREALALQHQGDLEADPATFTAGAQAVARCLLTLQEARRRREDLTEMLTNGRSRALTALADV